MVETLDPISLTQALVRYVTVNPPGSEVHCAHHLGDLLIAAGFTVSYHAGAKDRTNVVARYGSGGNRPLCFTGHIDTVPLGAKEWSVEPFGGEIVDGKLYGRGATDMKAGVAAFVAAAIAFVESCPDEANLLLVITAGEETGCEGAYHLVGENDLLGEAGALIVAEPSSNYPLVGHKGAFWLEAITRGVTAHGSTPEYGDNAVYKAARVVRALEYVKLNGPSHPVLGRNTLNVGTIAGGINLNSVPDVCRVGIDIRTTPGTRHIDLWHDLQRALGEDLDELQTVIDLEGVWSDPSHDWITDVFAEMASELGETLELRGAAFFTDASALTAYFGGVPTLILGPGEAALAHQTDEYCYVHRIEQATSVYKRLMQRWIERSP